MKIRPGTPDDASRIRSILHDAFLGTFLNPNNQEELLAYLASIDEDAIRQQMNESHVHFLVAESAGGEVLGFCQLEKKRPYDHSPDQYLMLDRLYIELSHLGTGLGKSIMLAALDYAKQQGNEYMWLMVLRPNTRAVAFYSKLGFKTFDTRPGKFKGDNELDLCMHIALT